MKTGMTNRSFLFDHKGHNGYVMRLPGEGSEELINRPQEYEVHQVLTRENLADEPSTLTLKQASNRAVSAERTSLRPPKRRRPSPLHDPPENIPRTPTLTSRPPLRPVPKHPFLRTLKRLRSLRLPRLRKKPRPPSWPCLNSSKALIVNKSSATSTPYTITSCSTEKIAMSPNN